MRTCNFHVDILLACGTSTTSKCLYLTLIQVLPQWQFKRKRILYKYLQASQVQNISRSIGAAVQPGEEVFNSLTRFTNRVLSEMLCTSTCFQS